MTLGFVGFATGSGLSSARNVGLLTLGALLVLAGTVWTVRIPPTRPVVDACGDQLLGVDNRDGGYPEVRCDLSRSDSVH